MKEKKEKKFVLPIVLALITVVFTFLVRIVDVDGIGPDGTRVGFAKINGSIHNALGVHMLWYRITEVLGILAILVVAVFAAYGFWQLLKRKSLLKVDRAIIVLGVIFIVMLVLYVFFELVVINYRPIIMPGETGAEASFPSSHTMLVYTVFGSVIIYFRKFFAGKSYTKYVAAISAIIIFVTVFGRLFSGVHWFTDIVGGALYSAVLLAFYNALIE